MSIVESLYHFSQSIDANEKKEEIIDWTLDKVKTIGCRKIG
jgi:hypothetical protein